MTRLRRKYEELDHSPFSDKEVKILMHEIPKHGASWAGFKRLLPNRSLTDIKAFAKENNISCVNSSLKSHKVWTDEENNLVVTVIEALSQKLKREPKTICNHAYLVFNLRKKSHE
ncbi:MAG: hypothetical protein HXK61_00005 [Atopobiaceae bacterium]|nr:hypothetical protein [Atopobiaceae bacterium]